QAEARPIVAGGMKRTLTVKPVTIYPIPSLVLRRKVPYSPYLRRAAGGGGSVRLCRSVHGTGRDDSPPSCWVRCGIGLRAGVRIAKIGTLAPSDGGRPLVGFIPVT